MTEISQARPAVFLDRDGTVIHDADYLASADELEVFDFAAEALRLFKAKGYLIFVVTNQSGITRGLFDKASLHSVHEALTQKLYGLIDGMYFCPHGPDDGCDCRKPRVGMIRNAMSRHAIDLANSWMIGDKKSDIETGFNSGTATALVLTGYGEAELSSLDRMPDIVAANLLEAARQICSRET